MTEETKKCPHCGNILTMDRFYSYKHGKHSSWCKECCKNISKDKYRGTYEPLRHRKAWTGIEVTIIRKKYADIENVQDLAEEIGRPVKSIYTLAHDIGLHRSTHVKSVRSRAAALTRYARK